jgi:hypothetical protein
MTILLSTGDRVLYTNPMYSTGMANPLWGTGYGCPGTVEDFDKRFVRVRWDNGRSNIYNPKALSKIIDEREGGDNNFYSTRRKESSI